MHKKKWNDGIVHLDQHIDSRGCLLPLDFKDLPFTPRRIFIVSNIPNDTERGNHAHKQCEQIVICQHGQINVLLFDGVYEQQYLLVKAQALYIPAMAWSVQTFYNDASSLVLASQPYNENDYIRNIKEFKNII